MLDKINGALDRLSGREKIMLGGMAGAIFLFVVFLGVFFVGGDLSEQRDRVESQRQALADLMAKKDAYLAAQANAARNDVDKIEGNDLNLTTFADEKSRAVGIKFDDFNDSKRPLFLRKRAPGAARGEEKPDLIEEQLEVTFKRVTLKAITAFLDRVDREEARPVAVKKIHIKTLWSDRAKLSGSITLATWKKPQDES